MTITVPQTLGIQSSAPSASLQSSAFGSAVAVGNTIVVGVAVDSAPRVITVTDNKGNTYTADKTSNTNFRCSIFRCVVATGGTGLKITVSLDSAAYISFGAAEIAGVTSTKDVTASSNGSSTTPSTGSMTTTSANEIILACTAIGGGESSLSITVPSGFTDIAKQPNGASFMQMDFAYRIVSAIQTSYSPQWTIGVSHTWDAVGVSLVSAATPVYPAWYIMQSCGNFGGGI